MSKKRKCPDDEQIKTNQSPGFQEEERAKRVKLTSLTAATIKDLPLELQERVLMETVVSEVTDRRLVRSARKGSADRVVERLRQVCPEWDYILTTKYFQNQLHRNLYSYPPVKMSLTVLVQEWLTSSVAAAALNDEVFVLRHPQQQHPIIDIYDRNNLQTVKSTIQLNEVTIPWNLVACSVTNCLYVLCQASSKIEILRISKVEHQFEVSPWISCSTKLISKMSISAEGSLILFQGPAPSTITTYNSDGSLKHRLDLAKRISFLHDIIPKSNGNVILVSRTLTELDRDGNVLCECVPPGQRHVYCGVGSYDSIMAVDEGGCVRLLDSEFNPWDVEVTLDRYDGYNHIYRMQYDGARNEFVILECSLLRTPTPTQRLTIVTFTEKTIPKDAQTVQN